MAQFSKSSFRGLLIPDERIKPSNLSASDSSYTQAGNEPGIPEPQTSTDLNLEASGTQSADKELRIATQRGGHPGQGKATFRWKNDADAATLWRGAWPANCISGWRTIKLVNPVVTTGPRAAVDPHAVLMDNGNVGVVYHRTFRNPPNSYEQVRFFTINEDGTLGSGTTVYESSIITGLDAGLHPCLMKLPSGRLMLYHYRESKELDTIQVQGWFSDDNGSNWTLSSEACLDSAIDISGSPGSGTAGYDLGTRPAAKMRVAYSGGQVLMLISMRANDTSGSYRDGLIQYASNDQGQFFEQVEIWGRTMTATQAEIVPSSNGFEVFYIGGTVSNDAVIRKSLSSAYIPTSTATQRNGPGVLQAGNWAPGRLVSTSGGYNEDADLAACLGDDGILYVACRGRASAGSYSSSNLCEIRMCMDVSGGASRNTYYKLLGQGTSGAETSAANGGTIYFGEGTADYPSNLMLCPANGRLMCLHNNIASTATRDDSLAQMNLGGYQTITLGDYASDGALQRRVCWDITYLPIEKPDNFNGWTLATGGGNSQSVNNGYLALETSAPAGTIDYYKTPTGTIAEGIIAHFGVQFVSSTGSVDQVFARFRQADGSDKYTIDVFILDGSIKVEDNNGGASLGTLSIDTKTNGVEVLVFMRSGKATVYARDRSNKPDETWSAVCSNAAVSDSGTGTMQVRFGHEAGGSLTTSSRWYFFNWVSDEYAGGTPSSTGFTNPDDLLGQPFSNTESTYVDDGVKIRGIDGPTVPGDTWNIDTRYNYSVNNIMVGSESSPAKGWRSTNESANTIAWAFQGANSYRTLGLYLDGCNWKTATLFGYNGVTSSWTSLASINMSVGQETLAYNRLGNTVKVNTSASTAAGRYYEMNEFIGGTIDLGSSKFRTITANTPGQWTNAAGHVRPMIEFSGLDNSEPASGTLNIWSPRILVVIHNLGNLYTKFKLAIDAQSTATDDIRIGQMVMGGLELLTQDYSWGRKIETKPNTKVTTYRDGSRTSKKLGDNRRSVAFGWAEGVDTTSIQGSAPTPDWLEGSDTGSAEPIGVRGDIPSMLTQINAHTAGPNLPVVYCPSIAAGTGGSGGSDTITMQGLQAALYGRIAGGIQLDALVGDELSSTSGEVIKVATVTVEEEL